MTRSLLAILRLILIVVPVFGLAACSDAHDSDHLSPSQVEELRSVEVPEQFRAGEVLFDRSCASCHGERALGTPVGPPLVHIVYEPRHHADFAFQLAVRQGVRAHHWNFGDMAPVPGLTSQQVEEITAYVRWLQRRVGIE
jgi:cytochrome c5